MGYWRADAEGHSLLMEETGMIWGDAPADIMGDALVKIFHRFQEDWHRNPTLDELKGGLIFSARGLLEDENGSN